MSTALLLRRLEKLKRDDPRVTTPEAEAASRFDDAIKRPGVMDRLWHIAEEGASDDDLEWLDRCTKETGFDFHAAVAACVKLSEEY